jgi:glycosyltransferase involved in cell wall biosynthesis
VRKLFFISTNEIWSGSEELWFACAIRHLNNGDQIGLATKYDPEKIQSIKQSVLHISLSSRFKALNSLQRLTNKFFKVYKQSDILERELLKFAPNLVVVSQGNNVSSLDIIELCIRKSFKFVTITQLVAEVHWLWVNEALRQRLISAYKNSIKNYFVSEANKNLHELMVGKAFANNEIIFNPVINCATHDLKYPDFSMGFSVAFVGRLEFFHKGLDVLLSVLMLQKWKDRPITFNFYGEGPHSIILRDVLHWKDIKNAKVHGYEADKESIWLLNHILILPSRMEGQSLSLLEALACGRTAIVTDVGGAREIIDDNVTGFIARAATVYDLDEAMERAWQKRANWREMGLAARETMKLKMPEDAVDYFVKKIEGLLVSNT